MTRATGRVHHPRAPDAEPRRYRHRGRADERGVTHPHGVTSTGGTTMLTTALAPGQAAGRVADEARWDDDGGAAPPRAGRAATRTQTHDYAYWLAVPGGRSACRIRIYRVGDRTIALATRRQDKFGGAALTDHAAALATRVARWHHPADDGAFSWVEQYEFPRNDGPHGARETFAAVSFTRDAAKDLMMPVWEPTTRAAVEALVGEVVGG